MQKWVYLVLLISTGLCRQADAQIDFHALNAGLGLCPFSRELTDVAKGGSYMATVIDARKFSRVRPDIRIGDRVRMYNLGMDEWIAGVKSKEIRFRVRTDVNPLHGELVVRLYCPDCDELPAGGATRAMESGVYTGGDEKPDMIFFKFNSAALLPRYFGAIDRVADRLKKNRKLKIQIQGHACVIGTRDYNQRLSRARARTVQGYLRKKGVDPKQVSIAALGESRPLGSNNTERGRRMNRRVQFVARR